MSDQHKVPPTLQKNFPEVVLQQQRVEVLPVFTFEWDTNAQLNTMASQFPVSFIFFLTYGTESNESSRKSSRNTCLQQ